MRIPIPAIAMVLSLVTPLLPTGALAQAAVPRQHKLEQADVEAWLDGLIPFAIEAGDIAGAVITVVADGKVLSAKGYGYADIEAGRRVVPDQTLFRPGSISKLITWTAVMQQVERGSLDLDADINAYLDFTVPDLGGEPITLRDILTHTAGFEEQVKHVLGYDPSGQKPYGAIVRELMPLRIFAPGTTPAYSNYGTALAGYIVERVSGQPFELYVAENIFAPLGMDSATFSQVLDDRQTAQLAKGYGTSTGAARPFELIGTTPAGSMSVTATDMAKFMLAHLNQGGQILEPATTELMHDRARAAIPSLHGMALGFYESSVNGHRVISHGGDTLAFHSDLHLFIEDGVGIFVSLNSAGRDGAAYKLRSLLFTQFADRYFPESDPRAPVDIGAGNARLLSGQWMSTRRSESNFLALGGLLSQVALASTQDGDLVGTGLPILGASVRDWVEVEPFVWEASNGHERIGAVVENGRVTRFGIDSLAPVMLFEPVPWERSAAWLLPALLGSLGVLASTALHWPVAALVRRRYKSDLSLTGTARTAYRGTKLAAFVVVAAFAGWFAFLLSAFADLSLLGDGSNVLLLTLQGMTIAGVVGLLMAATVNAYHAFADRRSLLSRIWAMMLVMATVIVVWVAHAFNLLALNVSY